MMSRPIYLDNQATTPLDPGALEAMLPYLTTMFGNASSPHRYGQEAATAIREARRQLGSLLGARSGQEIVFTSGATESNNLAIKGTALALRSRGDHIITTAIEHKSVLATCSQLQQAGFMVTYLPVDRAGRIDPAQVEQAITPRTILVSVMHANNEIGTIQPLAEIGAITRRHGIVLHTDAVQSVGTIPVDVDRLNVDLASVSAHKIYGPKGMGALYVRPPVRGGVALIPQLVGGGQEHGLRAGTANVAAIVGFGHAAHLLSQERERDAAHTRHLRDLLRMRLTAAISGLIVNGPATDQLPGNLSVTIPGTDATDLMAAVPDLALSTGSACTAGEALPSHVLTAIGMAPRLARGTLRLSVGRFNTEDDVDTAATRLIAAARRLTSERSTSAGQLPSTRCNLPKPHNQEHSKVSTKLRAAQSITNSLN
jgi:cysteine desulfurase